MWPQKPLLTIGKSFSHEEKWEKGPYLFRLYGPDFKINIIVILTSNPTTWLKQNLCLFLPSKDCLQAQCDYQPTPSPTLAWNADEVSQNGGSRFLSNCPLWILIFSGRSLKEKGHFSSIYPWEKYETKRRSLKVYLLMKLKKKLKSSYSHL